MFAHCAAFVVPSMWGCVSLRIPVWAHKYLTWPILPWKLQQLCIKQRKTKVFQLERKTWNANRHYYWPPTFSLSFSLFLVALHTSKYQRQRRLYMWVHSAPLPSPSPKAVPLYSIYIFYLLEIEKPTMHSIEKWNWKVAHWCTACLAGTGGREATNNGVRLYIDFRS